ncbi:MAG: YifB family Mg chelatase-like AAA ATPase [Akkermansiaceae bacterium]
MIVRVFSSALLGVEGVEIEVEVSAYNSEKPAINVVGLPDAAVRESSQRVTSALSNSALSWAKGVKTINLAPADIRKEGPRYDLPIALALAETAGDDTILNAEQYSIVGELALDGMVRPIQGVLPMALEAKRKGRTRLIVPAANAAEAAVVDGIEVYGVENLRQAWDFITGQRLLAPFHIDRQALFNTHRHYNIGIEDVKGQYQVKRALELAAAGGHNLLMVGPPGTGKSMIAKRLPTILPDMTEEEAIETTKIHSIAGVLGKENALLVTRPFRAPHHTISDVGLLGGGANPSPGEVSLAHHGVLFLDELPEFRRQTLEVMRQPLEDGSVCISRAAGTLTFPSSFMMIAAMNPCPCGYYGDPKRECRCSPPQIEKYRQRISGPLLDRIDLHVEVPLVEYRDLASTEEGEKSSVVRARVEAARALQLERFSENKGVISNAHMPSKVMREHCRIDATASGYLEHAMNELNFSARAHDRILKVARTLADLAGADHIDATHILEAIQYRTLDRKLMM